MGFQFNPTGTYILAAAALLGSGQTSFDEGLTIALNEIVTGGSVNGPKILI